MDTETDKQIMALAIHIRDLNRKVSEMELELIHLSNKLEAHIQDVDHVHQL